MQALHSVISGVNSCQSPVVQSMVSLTSSLREQHLNCFMTLQSNILIFFVAKIREAFAFSQLSTKNVGLFQILALEILMKH